MAISNRTRDLIERTIRCGPGAHATTLVAALNNAALNTTLTTGTLASLKKHVGNAAGDEIYALLRGGAKANLAAALGQDAYLKKNLWIWLKDRDAVLDVYNQIATTI